MMPNGKTGLRIAVLIKQVPKIEELSLTAQGRLNRIGLAVEINPYCRRAISKGVELARQTGGRCTILTLGPETAELALREAIAWGADRGVLITDPAFAGSDTLATAKALVAALRKEGPFDLILTGLNSVDADTGQVGPQVAELLQLPFAAGVRELTLQERRFDARLEHDDLTLSVRIDMPCVLSAAERLCEPAKKSAEECTLVPAAKIKRYTANDLGPGPWGQEASPTRVGEIRPVSRPIRKRLRFDGTDAAQVRRAVELLDSWGAFSATSKSVPSDRPRSASSHHQNLKPANLPSIGVILEPRRERWNRELCGEAAHLATEIGAATVALVPEPLSAETLGGWGADQALIVEGVELAEELAGPVSRWAKQAIPGIILAPGTQWGREVAARVAAALGAGLTGDAVELDISEGNRLVAWKPAFGGRLLAAVTATSTTQMATIRPGILPLPPLRKAAATLLTTRAKRAGRLRLLREERSDAETAWQGKSVLIGIGQGVDFASYDRLEQLKAVLDAELVATRKVTDKGWLPRARQIGLTGRVIAPRLYVAIGISGRPYHSVGIQNAAFILAINRDPEAPIFDEADIALHGDWERILPLLASALKSRR
jgi:electron transfer flavoprotein alpha subunit